MVQWADVSDFLVIMLCDMLWKTDLVYKYWVDFRKSYNLTESKTKQSEAEQPRELFALEEFVFLSAEKSGIMPPEDIPRTLEQPNWINALESDKISLIAAVKSAFLEESAETTINNYLQNRRTQKSGPVRFVIDAKGKFRRSGDWLYFPVRTELIKEKEALEE